MSNNISLTKENNEMLPVCGFDQAFFAGKHSVVLSSQHFIRHIDLTAEQATFKSFSVGGHISCITVSLDGSILVIGTEFEENHKLIIYSCNTFSELHVVSSRHAICELAISVGRESIVWLAEADDRLSLSSFDLKSGFGGCEGSIIHKEPANSKWQVSFCPADEGIICVLGCNSAYLLRSSNGKIENFSSISFTDVLCHSWTNDVTMAFGCKNGVLRLFRETIDLGIVDLTTIEDSSLRNFPKRNVCFLSSSSKWFGIVIECGVITVFPSTPAGPLWEKGKTIVLSEQIASSRYTISFDLDDNVLHTDGNHLVLTHLRYSGCISGGDRMCIAGRHQAPIVEINSTQSFIISLDASGLFVVTSKLTGRTMIQSRVNGAFYFIIKSCPHELLVLTKESLREFTITFHGLEEKSVLLKAQILLCNSSEDSSRFAILQKSSILVLTTIDMNIILEESYSSKWDVKQLLFSTDNKYLFLLTKTDHLHCMDIKTGKTLWSTDYKLHFFNDMAYSNGSIYLVDQKYNVYNIKHGKEVSTMNLHAGDVGYASTSSFIQVDEHRIWIAADNGAIVLASFIDSDEPVLLRPNYRFKISFFRIVSGTLLLGYENGSVAMFSCDESLSNSNACEPKDWILCEYSTVNNLKHLIRDVNYERGAIREQTDKLLTKYTVAKQKEITALNAAYAENVEKMRERLKKYEDGFEASEVSKAKMISNLQLLYEEESRLQKGKMETILNEENKKNIRLRKEFEEKLQICELRCDMRIQKQIEDFRTTENGLNSACEKYLQRTSVLEEEIETLKEMIKQLECNEERKANESKKVINSIVTKWKEERQLLENELESLQATIIRLNESKELALNNQAEDRSKLECEIRRSEQSLARVQILENEAEQDLAKRRELENQLISEKSKNAKLKQKEKLNQTELRSLSNKAELLARRCTDLECRITHMADKIYCPRKLEHAVLSLLSFVQNTDHPKQTKQGSSQTKLFKQ